MRDALPLPIAGGIFTLTRAIGQGGMATIYEAFVDLERFDIAQLLAHHQTPLAGRSEARVARRKQLYGELRQLPRSQLISRCREVGCAGPWRGVAAVKVMKAAISEDEEALTRFSREWQALIAVTSPHLISTYGGGFDAVRGIHYYAMELIRNRLSTRQLIDLPVAQKLDVIEQAARGLSMLHAHRMVHRDVKPENVLVAQKRDQLIARVSDLGIVKRSDDTTELTAEGRVFGTANYLPPEQLYGSAEANAASDVYSLGATLYHLLCGMPPYGDCSQLEVMSRLYRKEPPTALSQLATLPDPAIELTEQLMRMDAERRPQSMADASRLIAATRSQLAGPVGRDTLGDLQPAIKLPPGSQRKLAFDDAGDERSKAGGAGAGEDRGARRSARAPAGKRPSSRRRSEANPRPARDKPAELAPTRPPEALSVPPAPPKPPPAPAAQAQPKRDGSSRRRPQSESSRVAAARSVQWFTALALIPVVALVLVVIASMLFGNQQPPPAHADASADMPGEDTRPSAPVDRESWLREARRSADPELRKIAELAQAGRQAATADKRWRELRAQCIALVDRGRATQALELARAARGNFPDEHLDDLELRIAHGPRDLADDAGVGPVPPLSWLPRRCGWRSSERAIREPRDGYIQVPLGARVARRIHVSLELDDQLHLLREGHLELDVLIRRGELILGWEINGALQTQHLITLSPTARPLANGAWLRRGHPARLVLQKRAAEVKLWLSGCPADRPQSTIYLPSAREACLVLIVPGSAALDVALRRAYAATPGSQR